MDTAPFNDDNQIALVKESAVLRERLRSQPGDEQKEQHKADEYQAACFGYHGASLIIEVKVTG